MRIPNIYKIFSLLILLVFSAAATAAQYELGSGDVVRISVHGEPDLSFDEIRLTDAGTFTFPFIGEVDANGKTAGQVRALLTEKLKDGYLIDPRVSVSVVNYREFYIAGEVKLPGGYPYQPGLTLDRAIALAGGLTERASTKRMTIVRGSQGSRAEEKATMNTLVRPGDTINIDEGFF
ncbi:polysaccharide biosynthesis/export family protein [Stutzerimonas stutzeri]|uniref:polysaccharide biosynthesis/export family protein n=1 Tax=Stutzerimonas stutzeri TaxID=316 RepID=UPI00210DB11B|nr:polysaccharide biosynthesis/export family protein [Stutzerimonas stutzeri]MCQ4257582.1 polysaccharide export protein [Stutzerimonas stutzeri]